MGWILILGRAKDSFSTKISRAGPGTTQLPIQWVFSKGKWLGYEVDQSTPSSVKGKNEGKYTSTPTVCLHGMDKDAFTFTT
jgi:hypothetical protein